MRKAGFFTSVHDCRPVIHPLPENPLAQLHRLVDLITTLIGQLKQKLREAPEDDAPQRNYSALTQSPREWAVEVSNAALLSAACSNVICQALGWSLGTDIAGETNTRKCLKHCITH